jgi:2',3'-cyclic-nucleotide 2'-phosphodiesterase (5'-nucleotidase family)
MIMGNAWSNLFQGASAVELMNAMGFDVMVVGNHEFDFGQGELVKRIKEAGFPIMGANVEGLFFTDPVSVVSGYVNQLRGEVDVVVVVSHLGIDKDKLLAQSVPGIDVIVGGHTHTRLQSPEIVGGTLIVQAWEHGKALGVLDLTVESGGCDPCVKMGCDPCVKMGCDPCVKRGCDPRVSKGFIRCHAF